MQGVSIMEVVVSLFLVSLMLLGLSHLKVEMIHETMLSWQRAIAENEGLNQSERRNSSESGFSLIEYTIATAISLILLTIILTVLFSVKETHHQLLKQQVVQNQLIRVTALLREEMTRAGFSGYKTSDFIHKISYSESGSLAFYYMSLEYVTLMKNMLGLMTFYVSREIKFHPHDCIYIQDVQTTEKSIIKVVESDTTSIQKITLFSPLHKHFLKNATVRLCVTKTFFIAPTKRKDKTGKIMYALYQKINQNNKSELMEGINAMQVFSDSKGVKVSISTDLPAQWIIYETFKN